MVQWLICDIHTHTHTLTQTHVWTHTHTHRRVCMRTRSHTDVLIRLWLPMELWNPDVACCRHWIATSHKYFTRNKSLWEPTKCPMAGPETVWRTEAYAQIQLNESYVERTRTVGGKSTWSCMLWFINMLTFIRYHRSGYSIPQAKNHHWSCP